MPPAALGAAVAGDRRTADSSTDRLSSRMRSTTGRDGVGEFALVLRPPPRRACRGVARRAWHTAAAIPPAAAMMVLLEQDARRRAPCVGFGRRQPGRRTSERREDREASFGCPGSRRPCPSDGVDEAPRPGRRPGEQLQEVQTPCAQWSAGCGQDPRHRPMGRLASMSSAVVDAPVETDRRIDLAARLLRPRPPAQYARFAGDDPGASVYASCAD